MIVMADVAVPILVFNSFVELPSEKLEAPEKLEVLHLKKSMVYGVEGKGTTFQG